MDSQGFAPFGQVVQGMEVVRAIMNPTPGQSGGVDQGKYEKLGDKWIRQAYSKINFITNASISQSTDRRNP